MSAVTASATLNGRRRPDSLTRRLTQGAREATYASRAYALTLRGRSAQPELCPADIWQGDAEAANAKFHGNFRAGGDEIALPNQMPWAVAPPSAAWFAEMNSFEWIRDFRAAGGRAAAQSARDLTASWIQAFGNWCRPAWHAELLGRRLRAWVCHADFLTEEAPVGFATLFHESLQVQLRHLRRCAGKAPAGAPTIAALVGLCFAELSHIQRTRHRHKALEQLNRAIDEQILVDGGHIERNPTVHHRVLRDLVGLRAALQGASVEPPIALQTVIDRMTPMLRFYRHGDGGLALFNDSLEGDRISVDETLAAADAERVLSFHWADVQIM